MSYVVTKHTACGRQGCCLIGYDAEMPFQEIWRVHTYAAPMFTIKADSLQDEDVVLIEYGQIVDDWNFERPDPNAPQPQQPLADWERELVQT